MDHFKTKAYTSTHCIRHESNDAIAYHVDSVNSTTHSFENESEKSK